MTRDEIKNIIADNLHQLYGLEGEIQLTIEEYTTLDKILLEIYNRSIEQTKTTNHLSDEHKKKISNSSKGRIISEATKERMRKNSQRINVYQ